MADAADVDGLAELVLLPPGARFGNYIVHECIGQGAMDVSLWGRNLADEDWVMDSIGSFRGFIADRLAAFGEPRTVGVDFTFKL